MRSYDGESSSCEDEERPEVMPEAHLQHPAHWPRSPPGWAWEQRPPVSFFFNCSEF